MAYEKLKSESYQLLGGMNNKASPYNNTVNEFRNLTNFHFSQPGSIDKREGTTLFAQGSSTTILGLYEFNRLDGASYLLFNDSAGFWKTSLAGNTFIGGYTQGSLSGPNVGGLPGKSEFQTLNDWNFISIRSETLGTYFEAGYSMRKTIGSTLFLYGLPTYQQQYNVLEAVGSTTVSMLASSGGSLSAGVTATFYLTLAWVNNRGFIGPASIYNVTNNVGSYYRPVTVNGTTENSITVTNFLSPTQAGLNPSAPNFGLLTSTEAWRWGIAAIAVYISLANQTTPFYLTSIALNTTNLVISNLNLLSKTEPNFYGIFNYSPTQQSGLSAQDGIEFNAFYNSPVLEVYVNRLWMGGWKGYDASLPGSFPAPNIIGNAYESTVFYSEEGEPEGFLIENQISIRTNDGDEITGLKSYNNALVITKNNSIHQVNGTDPDNFVLNQVTDIYGCVNNRAMVIFNDILWMLDRKGIIQYNGANVQIVSTKMDNVFARMNYKAAQKEACAIFHKALNEVWFCFPVDSSEKNNMIVVFDIITAQWTKYEGFEPSVIAIAQSSLNKQEAFFGGYSGGIFHFGSSFYNDYGKSGMTCIFQTPYYAPSGHTTERQFRRFYLDVDPIAGASTPISLKFLPNFSSTIGHTASIYQTPFQSRIDFGVPAKSLSAEGSFVSATLPLKINGYTFESRFQRRV